MLGMSLWRCMEETSSTDFTKWMAFLELDPDPDVKRQFEHASTAAVIESVMSGKQVKIEDRIIKYRGRGDGQARQSPEEMQAVLQQLAARMEKQKAKEAKNPELAKKKQVAKKNINPKVIRGERLKG